MKSIWWEKMPLFCNKQPECDWFLVSDFSVNEIMSKKVIIIRSSPLHYQKILIATGTFSLLPELSNLLPEPPHYHQKIFITTRFTFSSPPISHQTQSIRTSKFAGKVNSNPFWLRFRTSPIKMSWQYLICIQYHLVIT